MFRGVILIRQTVTAIETVGAGPARRCEIHLADVMIRTAPQPRRAFQGWRYLAPADAPVDLREGLEGDIPDDLARRLREAGAW